MASTSDYRDTQNDKSNQENSWNTPTQSYSTVVHTFKYPLKEQAIIFPAMEEVKIHEYIEYIQPKFNQKIFSHLKFRTTEYASISLIKP